MCQGRIRQDAASPHGSPVLQSEVERLVDFGILLLGRGRLRHLRQEREQALPQPPHGHAHRREELQVR